MKSLPMAAAPLLPAPSHEEGEEGGKERAGLAIALGLLLFIPSGFPPPASQALSRMALFFLKARNQLRLRPQRACGLLDKVGQTEEPKEVGAAELLH